MKRFLLLAAPSLVVVALAVLPLATGARTLYLRDVLHSHYPLRVAATEALRQGELPLVSPYRSGGQPLLGNPNGLPLYPDVLLGLVASPLWALNAHFWLHWLLAPFAAAWMARAWGLSPSAGWATGVVYATGGFFLSLLNLANLVAGAALAPAAVAAALDATSGTVSERRRRLAAAAAGALWALLLVAGDPLYTALAALLAGGAVALRGRPTGRGPLVLALVLGTAIAAPQWVELLRIAPLSYRGHAGYSAEAALAQSWDPRTAVEQLLPLAFGDTDPTFWGRRFFSGNEPLLFSLAPGLLALALVVVAGRPRRGASAWGWTAIGLGLFLALGSHNPLLRLGIGLPGAGLLRYPVKVWLLVAVGGALLAGIGFERLESDGRRRLGLALAGLGVVLALGWVAFLALGPGSFRALDPVRLSPEGAAAVRLRWGSTALLQMGVVALLGASLYLARRRPALGGALLLWVHTASQLALLAPLYDSDEVQPYVTPPPLLADVDASRPLVHGSQHSIFGDVYATEALRVPDARGFWASRGYFEQLLQFAGAQWGLRYALASSPEGLDSFLSIFLVRRFPQLDDLSRIRILEALGVSTLLLPRDLDPAAAARARLATTRDTALGTLRVYALPHAADPVALLGEAVRSPTVDAALAAACAPDFDPRRTVLLAGDDPPPPPRPPGRARIDSESWERVEVEVESEAGGWLVLQRAHLGIYGATLDGAATPFEVANVQQIAVEVPAGRHRVVVAADRRPTRAALGVAAVALLALAGFALRARQKPP